MAGPPHRSDRAVSEAAAVVILVGFTVLVTASVGIGVLFLEDDDGEVSANFSFEHYSSSSMLVVTHERGDDIPAGRLVLSGEHDVTWAEIAAKNESEPVGPGDPIQLSANTAWGTSVSGTDSVAVYYQTGDGNRTLLDSWDG